MECVRVHLPGVPASRRRGGAQPPAKKRSGLRRSKYGLSFYVWRVHHPTVFETYANAELFSSLCNHERPHQYLDYRTPAEEHFVIWWRQTTLCRSESVAFVWMHSFLPVSWSKHLDPPLVSTRHAYQFRLDYGTKSVLRKSLDTPAVSNEISSTFSSNHERILKTLSGKRSVVTSSLSESDKPTSGS